MLRTPVAHVCDRAYKGGVDAMLIWAIAAVIPVALLGGALLACNGAARRRESYGSMNAVEQSRGEV